MPQHFSPARRRVMSRHLKILSALTMSLLLPLLSRAQTAPQKSANPQATKQSVGGPEGQTGRPDDNAPPLKPMPADQTTNIPYFTLRDGMNSTLTLNNTSLSPIPVTVAIYN